MSLKPAAFSLSAAGWSCMPTTFGTTAQLPASTWRRTGVENAAVSPPPGVWTTTVPGPPPPKQPCTAVTSLNPLAFTVAVAFDSVAPLTLGTLPLVGAGAAVVGAAAEVGEAWFPAGAAVGAGLAGPAVVAALGAAGAVWTTGVPAVVVGAPGAVAMEAIPAAAVVEAPLSAAAAWPATVV